MSKGPRREDHVEIRRRQLATGAISSGTESLLTHRWRETDSNLRSPEETTFSRPRRSRLQSPPSGRETGFLSEKEQGFKSAFRRRSKDAAP